MTSITKNKRLWIQIGFVLILGAAFVIEGTQVFSQPYQYQGSLIDPASPAPDFSLPSTAGSTFHLAEQRGKAVMIFFGFTHCPDICPTTLNDFKQVKKQLGDKAEQVEFVFITVDPERDSLEVISEYVSIFDPAFIGLSASEDTLAPVWDKYGVYQEKREVDSAAGYLVDHTARIYVVDPLGNLRLTFPQGMAPEAMADDISHMLSES